MTKNWEYCMFANKKFYSTLLVSLLLASCGNGGGSGVGGSPTSINELASVSCNNYIGALENQISEGFGTTKENGRLFQTFFFDTEF